ncbi:hypothetical protein F5B22DRAFT_597728 [Xylaria bambusicola]|uniref:uncharacterized protein n=1 Tax=Xylaria bambusicola TaxID=326684 RepID=UPI002008153D|nr:uncharacterized protein F5B22DRAFT_597728 [Xylaria bambusicola]KAI0521123.1 hypothetical protein F5B22DRAFT_597728 [Xylaria bambusicola]
MFPPSQTEKNEIAKQLLGSELPHGSTDTMFKAYFDYYVSVVCPATHGDALVGIDNPALQSHADLLRYIRSLHRNPSLSRDGFLGAALPSGDILPKEKDYVATVATKVAFMVDCSSKDYYSEGLRDRRDGLRPVKWEANQPLTDFMEQSFLSDITQTAAQQKEIDEMLMGKKVLKAWKLIRRYRIKIKPTNNLLEHLLYDPKERTLQVFHHTSFLRAHLKRSKNEPMELGFSKSLELGTLPPQLLFETLVSFHCILFPVASVRNERSHILLKKLIRTEGFDHDGLWVEFVRPIASDITFTYWGARLVNLYKLAKRPPPANAIVSWFERHTSERNALTVAIAGLFFAAVFGLLATIIGLVQLVISWLAWRYPVSSGS